jgi:DNA-binding transcriptional MerR regulator
MKKSDNSYKTIGEVAEILNLKNKKKGTLSTHTIRFWEKEFSQVKPIILTGNRRYFDRKAIDLLKKIKHLLKDRGMTINGVKKILKSKETLPLDETANLSIKAINLKNKVLNISKLIKNLK